MNYFLPAYFTELINKKEASGCANSASAYSRCQSAQNVGKGIKIALHKARLDLFSSSEDIKPKSKASDSK